MDKLQSDLGIWRLVWEPYRDSSQPKVSPTARVEMSQMEGLEPS